ncbi:MAG: sugar transferase [Clostridia bacterium]|nr:sugar transferase [Clostridia bacterium]MBR5922782.1 sugar transferase [Clostridia bacterium]
MLKQWRNLPEFMQTEEVKPYWDVLGKKRGQIAVKRVFDFLLASILIILFAIPMIAIAIIIKCDSSGPVFFRQERVTAYGKHFRIHKFRTMVTNAEKLGSEITSENDPRITKAGLFLRNTRLDELPQLIDVISGNMSFVGTRPETLKYVSMYKPEYFATLLLPAGITSKASVAYKDEALLLTAGADVEDQYLNTVLPEKMKINLDALKNFSLYDDISVMFTTVFAVLKKGNR